MTYRILLLSCLVPLITLAAACGSARPSAKGAPPAARASTAPANAADPGAAPPASGAPRSASIQSEDILAREAQTMYAQVKHVLIAWGDGAKSSGGKAPGAPVRTEQEAMALAVQLLERVRAGEDIDMLMAQYSADPGSAQTGQAYVATPSSQLVFEFKRMSLRLKVGEAGLVKSSFGWHVIKRVK